MDMDTAFENPVGLLDRQPVPGRSLTAEGERLWAIRCYQEGNHEEAAAIISRLVHRFPQDPNLKHLYAIVLHTQGNNEQASDLLSKALIAHPDHPHIHNTLGTILQARGKVQAAILRFQDAIRLDPDCIDARCNLALILIEQKKASDAINILIQVPQSQQKLPVIHRLFSLAYSDLRCVVLSQFHTELFHHYSAISNGQKAVIPPIMDTYFLDPKRAEYVANRRQRIQQTPVVSGIQLCYYSGEPVANPVDNLIPLAEDTLIDCLITTRLRRPTRVECDLEKPGAVERALRIAGLLDHAGLMRSQFGMQCFTYRAENGPEFPPRDKKWRIYLSASRLTVVMQYSARDLANAFRHQGHSVMFSIENNEMECLDFSHMGSELVTFNPHIIININHLNNDLLHKDVFNVVWWQDLMPTLQKGKPVPIRQRDLIFSTYPLIDDGLRKCGIHHFDRQDMCIDTSLFYPSTPLAQRKKIVFIGSGTLPEAVADYNAPSVRPVYDFLLARFMNNEPFSLDILIQIATDHTLGNTFLYGMFSNMVREKTLEWLCQLAPSLDLEVEVYGRNWERNEKISPYFKGELAHGADVARVYNEAKYGICVNPMTIKSQRLSEISACGCIPVVYDARSFPEPPYWDDECLFFSTQEELRSCFQRTPKNDPIQIAMQSSFDHFAKRIIAKVHEHLSY